MSDPVSALMFLIEAGADEAIGEVAIDRMRRSAGSGSAALSASAGASSVVSAKAGHQTESAGGAFAIGARSDGASMARGSLLRGDDGKGRGAAPALRTNDEVIARARALAAAAGDLDALRAAMENFDGCALRQTATQLVFADGTPGSPLVIVGEAPGRDEDLAGKPFVGRSGQLLDRMLDAIGLDRSSVYIINVVPWRPPGNRKPTPAESQICRPFVERQIALSGARVALLLGGAAVSALLAREEGIMKLRGRWFDLHADSISLPALATFHPAYLLRAPAEKRLAWRDFLALRTRLDAVEEGAVKS